MRRCATTGSTRPLRDPPRRDVRRVTPPIDRLIPKDDPDWIPDVARRGWVVITNDRHIRTRPAEAPKAIEVGLRCVHLEAGKDARVWDFLRLLLRHWDDVEALCSRTGPVWLQLDARREAPWERQFDPGRLPRLAADPRAERVRRRSDPPAEPNPNGPGTAISLGRNGCRSDGRATD